MYIGKIVRADSHISYLCQVYGPGEAAESVRPEDYSLGSFVGIEQGGDACLIGIIYDTMLMNPEFGNLGPRLSPPEDLAVFAPDYLREKATLVAIAIVGRHAPDGSYCQGVPEVAAEADALVSRLSDGEIESFHTGPTGRLSLAYAPLLASLETPLAPYLLLQIIERLKALFPQDARYLAVLADNLAWKARVEPLE